MNPSKRRRTAQATAHNNRGHVSTTAPVIRLPEPPAWLGGIPNRYLMPGHNGMMEPARLRRLEEYLHDFGLPRPSLAELEAERIRRGLRVAKRPVVWDGPGGSPDKPLPLLGTLPFGLAA